MYYKIPSIKSSLGHDDGCVGILLCEGVSEGLLKFVRIFRIPLPGVDGMVSGDVTYGQIVIVTTLTCNFQPLGLFRTKEVYTYMGDDEATPEGTSLFAQGTES